MASRCIQIGETMPRIVRIVFIRHAQPNEHDKLLGQKRVGLSTKGVKDAKEFVDCVIDRFGPEVTIYSSPLPRSLHTAAYLSMRLMKSIHIIPELKEIDLGIFSGKRVHEFNDNEKEMWKQLHIDPYFDGHGGESQITCIKRINNGFQRVIDESGPINLVFCHEGVMRTLLSQILKLKSKDVRYSYLECVFLQTNKSEEDLYELADNSMN